MTRSSFLLLEMLLSIMILSFVGIYFYKYISEIYTQNQKTTQLNIKQIELQSTQIFIKNKLTQGESIDNFYLANNTLYYKGNILLLGVDIFNIKYLGSKIVIDIAIDNKRIIQQWLI
ncbi:hypothetical protein [Arcobacter sp. FWKO B]|uniref:hypothetical protein n=1 Tax=Arcobacter sp. FWKO B TaxID=2593672 RepID=UPI0018A366BC|nr:hypothetical protein [Arcobacter sp. FWKO B]QOG12889.1 hypothetical protein FWKOB_09375 [Arcobacter sp. FWKO B]